MQSIRALPKRKALVFPRSKNSRFLNTQQPRKMSLFPRFSSSVYAPFENDLKSLFRLIDNVGSRYENSQPTSVRAFAPRFDVEERENEYYLHGELPGIDQKDIEIEFTDSHTLVIKGSNESYIERRGGDAPVTDTAQETSAQS